MRLGLVAMWNGVADMQKDLAVTTDDLARIKGQVYPTEKALPPIPLEEVET